MLETARHISGAVPGNKHDGDEGGIHVEISHEELQRDAKGYLFAFGFAGLFNGFAGGTQEGVTVFAVGFEVGTFAPFIPGIDEDEGRIKEETGATVRCIPFDQPSGSGTCFLTGKPSSTIALFAKAY